MQDHLFPLLLKQSPYAIQENASEFNLLVEETLHDMKQHLFKQTRKEALCQLLSTYNYIQRSQRSSHSSLTIKAGDVCFIDFGHAYLHEAGYQHFGLVMSSVHGKIFVIPMTSNPNAYKLAYDPIEQPEGKKHLYRFQQSCGLNRPSVLFLNDCKFISPLRVIEVKGNLSPESDVFKRIQKHVFECLLKTE